MLRIKHEWPRDVLRANRTKAYFLSQRNLAKNFPTLRYSSTPKFYKSSKTVVFFIFYYLRKSIWDPSWPKLPQNHLERQDHPWINFRILPESRSDGCPFHVQHGYASSLNPFDTKHSCKKIPLSAVEARFRGSLPPWLTFYSCHPLTRLPIQYHTD